MLDTNKRASIDWYAATVSASFVEVESGLSAGLSAVAVPARGMHGYPQGTDFTVDGNVVAKMIWGGDRDPHVWASGADAASLAGLLRAEFPRHSVTRFDSAFDFVEGSPWASLYESCMTTADYLPTGEARQRPLKVATVGDWVREEEGFPGGRTLYVGSMRSPVFARLYEKGKQMRALYPDQLDKYPVGWVRLELQVRGSGDVRKELSELGPEAVWGASQWSRQLHSLVFGSELSSVLLARHRPDDDARAWAALLRQYGPLLRRKVSASGELLPASWAALGRELGLGLGLLE